MIRNRLKHPRDPAAVEMGKKGLALATMAPRLALAGQWESWKDTASGEETVETYAIITAEPFEVAGKIHHRMPVIIDPADLDRWLSAAELPADLLILPRSLRDSPFDLGISTRSRQLYPASRKIRPI
jgi:putative SOS response-associated peptidase YedK